MGALPQVFVPLSMRERLIAGWKGLEDRRNYWAYVFARLQPGVTIDQAKAAVDVRYAAIVNDVEAGLQKGMSPATLARFKAKRVTVEPGARGQSRLDDDAKVPLNLLLAVTAFVLLIACANIANLLLARGASRASEMAVRLSIGASRWQVVRQLLTESAVLAAIGAVLGLLVARWTLTGIIALVPAEDTSFLSDRIDPTTLLFAAAVAIGTGLLFGLFPALHSTRPDLVTAIKNSAGQPSGARAASRFRTALATTQIALSTMLLILAGLFTKSLTNISRVELGIDTERLVTFGLSPDRNGYTPARSKALFERVEDELAAIPGVSGSAVALVPLLANSNWGNGVSVQGFAAGPDTDNDSMYNEVGPGYFGTVGMRLLAGRDFTRGDVEGGPKVAIVNEAFARKFKLTGQRRRLADGVEQRRRHQAGHRDRRPGEGRQVQRRQARDSAGLLHALPAGSGGRLGQLLRAHAARSGRAAAGDPAHRGRASTRTCRSRSCARWRSRSAATSASIGSSRSSPPRSPSWRRCWPRSGSTACSPTRSRSGPARSACGWRSAPTPAASGA